MELIDLSTLPNPETRLRDFLDSVCQKHELDYAAYAGMNNLAQTIHGVVNYPPEWQMLYMQQGLQMLIQGQRLKAIKARAIGLIDDVVPAKKLIATAKMI